jgi:uncharacterized membrane protein YgcG
MQQQQQQQQPSQPGSSMPEAADSSRVLGNNALFEQSYSAAIGHFTDATQLAPHAAGLYTQRALALLKRGWQGDAAYALRDCETALNIVTQRQQQQQQDGDGSNGSSVSSGRESSGGGRDSSSSSGSSGSSVEQQARLRLVHALKQLGQVKVRLAKQATCWTVCPVNPCCAMLCLHLCSVMT